MSAIEIQNSYKYSYHGHMATYSVIDAKNNLSRLIEAARSGDRVIIAKRGVPTVEIVPVTAQDQRLTGAALAAWLAANPLPQRLSRTSTEIDRQISTNREAWE